MTTSDEAPGIGLSNLTGKQLGRYLIGERLGSGGAATVYRAFDQVQGATIALKVLLPSADEKSYTRFRREALTAGALRHPNIVRILQVGTAPHGEVAYIAMELVEGESLADLLSQRRILPPHESCALLAPIARALAHAHAAGVIHRDVKPSNILLRPVGRGDPHGVQLESLDYPVAPLLSDFGIARSLDAPELTSVGRTVGTPAYMAPEQAAGSRTVDGRADIYALGTVLYRCVTGRLPFVGSATQILHAHVYEPLAIDNDVLAWIPPELVQTLSRSLAKRPEARFQSPLEMADALERVAARAPLAHEHDPFSTATMEPAAVGFEPPRTPSSTTILVPGVGASAAAATGQTATQTISPYAPGAGAAAQPRQSAPPPSQVGAGGAGGSGAGGEEAAGLPRRRRVWMWAAAIVLFVLLGGATAALVTSLGRDRGTVAAALTPTPTLTMTPTPSPTPTGALGTPAPATIVIVVPPEGERTPLPTFVLPPTATHTPTFAFVLPTDTPTAPPLLTPTLVLLTYTPTFTPSFTPSPAPSFTPTWTAVPPTFTPLPPTATPTVMPSPTITPTQAPPPLEPSPVDSPTPPPPPGPTVVLCAEPIAPELLELVNRLDAVTRPGFECPTGPPARGGAQMLDFERGTMIVTGGTALVQTDGGRWEQFLAGWNEGDPSPLPADLVAPDGLFLPQGAFAVAWLAPGVRDSLGFATAAGATAFNSIAQNFAGGMLMANLDSGDSWLLPAGNRGL